MTREEAVQAAMKAVTDWLKGKIMRLQKATRKKRKRAEK